MQVILKEDVANLGYKDDIVTVKNGYGRNYLIPTGKAVIASESARKVLAENLKQRAHKLAKIKADAEELAAEWFGSDHRCQNKCDRHDFRLGKQHPSSRRVEQTGFRHRPQDYRDKRCHQRSWFLQRSGKTAPRSVGRNQIGSSCRIN